jgi:hypothetical protein
MMVDVREWLALCLGRGCYPVCTRGQLCTPCASSAPCNGLPVCTGDGWVRPSVRTGTVGDRAARFARAYGDGWVLTVSSTGMVGDVRRPP